MRPPVAGVSTSTQTSVVSTMEKGSTRLLRRSAERSGEGAGETVGANGPWTTYSWCARDRGRHGCGRRWRSRRGWFTRLLHRSVSRRPSGNDLPRSGVFRRPRRRPQLSPDSSIQGPGAVLESGRFSVLVSNPGCPRSSPLQGLDDRWSHGHGSPCSRKRNMPLRHGASYGVVLPQSGLPRTIRSPLVNDVPGAIEIQRAMERAGGPISRLAPRSLWPPTSGAKPLAGVPPKAIIVQFPTAIGVVPNPATAELLRKQLDLVDPGHLCPNGPGFRSGEPLPSPRESQPPSPRIPSDLSDPTLTALALRAEWSIIASLLRPVDGDAHVPQSTSDAARQITDPDPRAAPIFRVPIVLPLSLCSLNYPPSGGPARNCQFPSRRGPRSLPPEPAVTALETVSAMRCVRERRCRVARSVCSRNPPHLAFATDDGGKRSRAVDIYNLSGRHVRRIVGSGAHADRAAR